MADIKPGQWVTIKIIKQPRAAAQRKTLVRLCEKDPVVKVERVRLKRSRVVRFDRRGGRPWADRPARIVVVKTRPGATYRIFASVDVCRDLASVAKNVEVTPA